MSRSLAPVLLLAALGASSCSSTPRVGDPSKATTANSVTTDQEFEDRYGHTPLERPGPAGMRRNARIARDNSTLHSACPTY